MGQKSFCKREFQYKTTGRTRQITHVAYGKKTPLRQMIYSQILEDILTGRINSGEKLTEADLAKRFNVSRTPIREALLQLEKEEFVVHKKHVGAVVRKVSARQVEETHDVVALLESYATEIAAPKMTERDVSALEKLQVKMKDCLKESKFSSYVKLNAEFHDVFSKKCGNEKLRESILDLRKSIYRVIAEGQTLPRHASEYLKSHEKILEAVKTNKPSEAAQLMKSHVLDSKVYIVEFMLDTVKLRLYT